MSQQSASNVIRLDQPGAGETRSVPINAENMRLSLGFEPDPNAVEKNGQNLEFSFEDGGKLVLEGYYNHFEGKTLPVMVTEEGDELAGEDFLASLREDLLTAAGPSAGSAMGRGGAGEYADDAGALIDGVGRLGSLGTIYWDRETEVVEELTSYNPEMPSGGGWDFDVVTDLNGVFVSGAFEDGQANQHMGDKTVSYAQIVFNPQLGGSTVIDAIRMSGFEPGTRIYLGDPETTEPIIIESYDQVVTFSHGNFQDGVYLVPPADSDADMTITVEVDLRAESSGLTETVTGEFTIIVDAVADMPFDLANTLTDDGSGQHHMSQTEQRDQKVEDGLESTTYSVTTQADEGVVNVSLEVTVSFTDYLDGSELHYVLVQALPGFSGPYDTIEIDGVTYFQIPVDNASIEADGGTVTIDVTLTAPHTGMDQDYSIQTGAMSVEQPGDAELTLDNNTSIIFNDDTLDFKVDVINAALTVEAGWASEANNDAKHIGADSGDYEYGGREAGATLSDGGTNNGAPFTLGLSGTEGSTEFIDSVVFAYDAAQGTLYYNGEALVPGQSYDFSGQSLPLNFSFVPHDGYDSTDVEVGYTVTVGNEAGASATFQGSSTIVIDAVADQGILGQHTMTYDDGKDAAIPGAIVTIDGSIQFHDTDGSELHYAVIAIPNAAFGIAGLEGGTLSSAAIIEYWRAQGGMPEAGADAKVDGALSGAIASGDSYLLIEVDPATGVITLYVADGNGNLLAVDPSSIPGLEIAYVNGQLTYTLPIRTPSDIATDDSVDISVSGVAVEKDPGDGEYDYANNIAVTDDSATMTVVVDGINSELQVDAGWASEANNDAKHIGGDSADYEYEGPGAENTLSENGENFGAPFTLNLSGEEGSTEFIQSVVFDYDDTTGTLFYNGQPMVPGESYDFSGESLPLNFSFLPHDGYDSTDVDLSYTVTVSNETGASTTFTGESILVVDAVADQGILGDHEVSYGGDDSRSAAEPGEVVNVSGSIQFHDTDGSELHYAVIAIPNGAFGLAGLTGGLLDSAAIIDYWRQTAGMPEAGADAKVDQALADAIATGDCYLLIEVDPATGAILLYFTNSDGEMVSVDASSIPGLDISYVDGQLTYTLPIQTPADGANDDSVDITISGVALEKDPEDGEIDFANNIAVTDDSSTVTIDVDVITGQVELNVDGLKNLYEDGMAGQWTDKDGNAIVKDGDPADKTVQEGFGEFGIQIFMPDADGNFLQGASDSEYVSSITFSNIPDASQGTLYYKGQPITEGQTIENPDLSEITFKPTENWSGDTGFTYQVDISSETSKQTVSQEEKTADIHVDSVADLADAETKGLTQDKDADGNYAVQADDGAARTDEHGNKEGWYDSYASNETPVIATLQMSFTLYDLDGSETASILIPVNPDITLVADIDGNTPDIVTIDGVQYYVYATGEASELQAALDANGGTFEVKVSVSPDAQGDTVKVYVRTEEDSTGHKGNETGNDAAMREVGEGIDMSWLKTAVTVSTGWTYEGGDGSKHIAGDNYNPDLGAVGGDSTGTVEINGVLTQGAPVVLTFGDPDTVTEVTFTYHPDQGTLYFDGVPIPGTPNDDGTVTVKIVPQSPQTIDDALDNMVFVPSSDYGDQDIDLNYTVKIEDGGNSYLVEGSTKVVVDAVADRAEVQDTSALAGDDNASVIITVQAEFPDNDGSEQHYILVEVQAGWSCPDAVGTTTVYYDAQGNVMQPSWDPVTQKWGEPAGYDEGAGCTSKEFWQVDVSSQTNKDNPETSFDVTLKPTGDVTDTTFETGTMAVEKPGDEEYDYNNNVAYDFIDGGTTVNVMDADIKGSVTGAYEDNQPNQHKGDYKESTTDGVITVTIGKQGDNGFENSGEYLNTVDSGEFVVITFDWAGDKTDTGTFTVVGGDGTEYPVVWDEASQSFMVKIPTSAFGDSTDQLDKIQVQYHPPTNDDTDLKDINVSVPVRSEDTGYTETLEGKLGDMIVDAVADKPTDVDTSVKIDASEENTAGYGKADWGSEIEITVGAKFHDYEDGSETHYLLIEARDGWTCDNADGVIEIGGTLYYYKEVSNDDLAKSDGESSFTFTMKAPEADGTGSDVTTIGKDGTVTFETGGLAIEGGLKDKGDGSGTMVPDTKGSDGSELTLGNNVSFTPDDKGAVVDFNTITDSSSSSGSAYEDHRNNQHTGSNAELLTSGWIKITLGDAKGESIDSGSMTFKYAGDGDPGTFSYKDANNQTQEIKLGDTDADGNPVYFQNPDGSYTVVLPDDVCGGGSAEIRYNPPANDDTDLTDFTYSLNVSANDSKAEGTIEGTLNNNGKLVVDAVADRPEDIDLPGSKGTDKEITYTFNDSSDHQAAAPGGEVTIPVSCSFGDYLDGSEKHYIIIQNVNGWKAHDADGTQTIGGTSYYKFDVTGIITDAVKALNDAGVDGYKGGSFTYTDPATGVKVTISVDADGNLGERVDVSMDVTMDVPDNASKDQTFKAGGYAEETVTDGELTTSNNTAINTGNVTVAVDPVESKPTITMDNDHIYENLKPNEHGAQKGDANYVNVEDDQPATMKFEGLKLGETAEVTLYFSASNSDGSAVDFSGGKVMVRDANGDYILGDDGQPLEVSLEGPDANGNFYTVPALVLDGDSTIEFYPGENYSDRDISVNYDITVTDDASGAQHTWTTQEKPTDGSAESNTTYDQQQGGIQVDAVAQAPDVDVKGGYGDDGQGNDYSAFPNGTAQITIDAQMSFPDWQDGSELHYLLVEAQPGYEITTITITGPDGQTWTFDLADGQNWMFDGTAYVRFELSADILQACGGDLSVTIAMSTPDGVTGSQTFKVGGMSQEDPGGLDAEATRDNNQAVKVDEVEVKYQGIGNISVTTKDSGVYEGDAANAHEGKMEIEGGTEVIINLPGSPNVVTDISLSATDQNGDPNGTIYVFPKSMSDAEIKALLEAGGDALKQFEAKDTYSAEEISNSKVIYIAESTYDGDANITVTGTVTNPNTGQSYTSTDNAEVIVDAVAQQGKGDGDDTADDGSYTIAVSFDDMDGSEEHFVLIEAKPGCDLEVTRPDGTLESGPYEMYYHVHDDGSMTAYWKVPVDSSDLNADGSYEINFTYDGAGEFKYGSMGEETTLDGGELTYHNNTSISEDGSLGDPSGGGGKTLPDDQWIPPGGGHKCPHPEADVTNSGAYENGTPDANIGDNSVGKGDAILDFTYITWSHHNDKPGPNGEDGSQGGSWCSPSYNAPDIISITFNAGECALLYNGEYIVIDGNDGSSGGVSWTVTDNGDGTFTVTFNDYDGSTVALRPGDYSDAYKNGSVDLNNLDQYHNNSDADFSFEWSMTGKGSEHADPNHGYNPDGTFTAGGTGTVIVDAVAQGVVDGSLDYNDGGHIYGEKDNNDTTTVKLQGKVVDTDESEACFFLIEAVPGVSVAGAETIYIDGTMYYKVPATVDGNGNATANVELTIDRGAVESGVLPGTDNGDGTTTYELKYGAMTEEQLEEMANGDGELTYNNNMSFNTDNTMQITVSYVDSEVRVTTTDTYENDATSGAISVMIDLDDNDKLDEFSITYDPDAGEIVYYDGNGNLYTADGAPGSNFDDIFTSGWKIETNPDGSQTLVLTNPDPSLIESGLTFSTDGSYSSTDTSITWEAKVSDTASGDTETFGGKQDIVIDAVAQAPDVTDVFLTSDGGNTAALSGGEAQINLTLTFEDVGTGEMHYAVMAYDGVWTCGSITVVLPDGTEQTVTPTLMYDQQGNPYYAVEIPDTWLKGDGSVDVKFNVTAPESGGDATYDLKVGGISVESFNQPDGELTLSNNWAEKIENVQVKVGVAETTEVNFEIGALVENDPAGAAIALTQASKDALANNSEILTETTLTFTVNLSGGGFGEGDTIGTVIYDGKTYEVVSQGGKGVVAIDFGPNGYDDSKEFRLVWGQVELEADGSIKRDGNGDPVVSDWNHTGSNMTVTADSTVKDTQSGETGEASGGGSVGWTATADAPTDIAVTDPTGSYGDGMEVTFTVTADFVDVDGSEQHYILVEKQDGWGSKPTYSTYTDPDTAKTYFMVPVDSKDPNPTVDITLTVPGGLTEDKPIDLEIGGMAKDGNDTATTFDGDKVTIDIGVVQATGVSLSVDPMVEDGGTTPMTFTLEGGNDDSIASIKITDLGGGKIVSPDGKEYSAPVTFTDPQQLQDLQDGKYSYKPADNKSGDVTIKFEATVTDDNSGSSKPFTGQEGKVEITPVTDTPVDQTGKATDPSNQAGHTASVTITLTANFVDYTGTEAHFFLVQLPAGMALPAGWTVVTDPALLAMSGMSSPVYMVTLSGNNSSTTFTLTVPENYNGGDLTYKAGSYEKDLPDSDPNKYQFSDADTVDIGATGDINFDPTASDSSATVADALRDPDAGASGKVTMQDADKDDVTVTKVTCTDSDGNVSEGQPVTVGGVDYLEVKGEFGTLLINVETGQYTYTLHDGAKPPHGYQENFSVTVSDDRGATDGASITISINAANADPTAVDPNLAAGGVNESELTSVTGQVDLRDSDGDEVTITGVTGGQSEAAWDPVEQTWTVEGKYGTLVIDQEGNYEYTLTDHNAQGKEEFTFSFQDPYGGTGQSTFTVNVDFVNHAPVIENQQAYFDSGSGSFINGKIAFSDPDTATQSDVVAIAYVVYDGTTYEIGSGYTAIETEWGTLSIKGDGSYVFTANDNAGTADTWEHFTVGVSDSHGVVSEGQFSLGLGDHGALPLAGGASASIGFEGDSLLALGADASDADPGDGSSDAGMFTMAAAAPTVAEGEDMFGDGDIISGTALDLGGFTGGDLMGEITDTILDFSMGDDKLFLEDLFASTPANMLDALYDKIGDSLDVSVSADGSEVHLNMDGQMVDIHLTDNLGADIVADINSGDTAAKAQLLEQMIILTTG